MKCENVQFSLSLYADGVLTDEETLATETHLAHCPLCRQKLDDFASLRQNLRAMRTPAMPADLLSNIKQSVRAELAPATTRRHHSISNGLFEFLQMRVMPLAVGSASSVIVGIIMSWLMLSNANIPNSEIAGARLSKPAVALPIGADVAITDFIAERGLVSNESPSVNPRGALLELTNAFISGRLKEKEVMMVADVHGNGLAEIEEIVAPLDDEATVFEVERTMRENSTDAPFVPASLDRRAENMRVVILIQRVDVPAEPDIKLKVKRTQNRQR